MRFASTQHKTFVSTDHETIIDGAKEMGIPIITRPDSLCTDEALFEDALVHAYFKIKEIGIKKNFYKNFDTYKDEKNFFSYRRSKDKKEMDCGRCISIISLI